MRGTMRFFYRKKGYGFIRGDDGKDAFVHLSNIAMAGSRILETGDKVEYEEEKDDKGVRAINLKLVG